MRIAFRIVVAMVLVGFSVRAWGAEPSSAAITIFSFDNVTIPFTQNLYLTMVPASKYPGNPVLAHGPEGSTDAWRAQFYGSIIKVDGKYRMWYCAEDEPNPPPETRPYHYWPAFAESLDGIHWTKPKLGLVEHKGNKENNLLQFSPQPHFELTEPLVSLVLYEPSDPNPSHRYKMTLYGLYYEADDVEYKHPQSTIYPYFSADGLRWQLATPPPKGDAYTEAEAPIVHNCWFELGGFYKFGGLYYVAGQKGGGEKDWAGEECDVCMPDGKPTGRVMVVHWSNDFVHWSRNDALSFVRYGYRSLKENLDEAHEPAAVWNRNNVLVAIYGLWHGVSQAEDPKLVDERRMPLGFLISNDGIHFREPQPDFQFISPGADGEWDQRGLIHGQGFENVGDQTRVYYGTWDPSAERSHSIAGDPKGSVGLVTLRRDGFGYLSVRVLHSRFASRNGTDEGGMLTTMPISFPRGANHIWVNASGLGQEAHLRLELLDQLGKGVPGYSGAQGAVVDQEGVAEPVGWSSGQLPAGPGPYRLRIHFEGADRGSIRFYAAYVE